MDSYYVYIGCDPEEKIIQYKELLCIDKKEAERRGLETVYSWNNRFGYTYWKFLKVRKVPTRKGVK